MDQRQLTIVIAVIAALVVIAVISFLLARKRRSQQLRARFGPEYDRVLKKEGTVRSAEGVLERTAGGRHGSARTRLALAGISCNPSRKGIYWIWGGLGWTEDVHYPFMF